ncbi:MAG TPA: helix-turn-helix domain-containing protein [Solirubrobacteraceae bacterium]|nr:helix-turn-helix domain-containing protein [Solirubrobacteraceae bacterium]
MSADRDESFLTVAEVADWLKVNQQTVRNWIDQGRLPAVRVGRRVRIKRSDFDWLMGGDSGSGPPAAGTARSSRPAGPNAEDFWSGQPVGVAEPDPSADSSRTAAPQGSGQSGHGTGERSTEPERPSAS